MGGRMPGGRALEMGCGRGVGVELILAEFGATAFDLTPQKTGEIRYACGMDMISGVLVVD